MAAIQQHMRLASSFAHLLPRISTPFRSTATFAGQRQFPIPAVASLAVTLPAVVKGIPSILGDIWEGILRAVPKSKTSHMKKRHRQMAGKALKDVNNLNRCPACGGIKKMHTLCTDCMSQIEAELKAGKKSTSA